MRKSDQAKFNKAIKKALYRRLGRRVGRDCYVNHIKYGGWIRSLSPREIAELYVMYQRISNKVERRIKAALRPGRRRYSVEEVRQELGLLADEYNDISEQEREADQLAEELAGRIREISNELKEAEQSVGITYGQSNYNAPLY